MIRKRNTNTSANGLRAVNDRNPRRPGRWATLSVSALLLLVHGTANTDETAAEKPSDILVVVNKSSPISRIEPEELKSIFLKKKEIWSDGTRAVPINAPEGSKIREAFRRSIIGFDRDREETYWQDQMIKHGLRRPPEFSRPLKAVFKLRGAVSYVYRSEYRQNVAKVILVLR